MAQGVVIPAERGVAKKDQRGSFTMPIYMARVSGTHKSDLQCGTAAYGGAIGCGVLSVEGKGGGVVVQLLQGDVELLDHMENELGEHSVSVGVEESVEGSSDAVVVELAELSGGAAQQRGKEGGGPFDDGRQRASGEDEPLQECSEGKGGVEVSTRIQRGEVWWERN